MAKMKYKVYKSYFYTGYLQNTVASTVSRYYPDMLLQGRYIKAISLLKMKDALLLPFFVIKHPFTPEDTPEEQNRMGNVIMIGPSFIPLMSLPLYRYRTKTFDLGRYRFLKGFSSQDIVKIIKMLKNHLDFFQANVDAKGCISEEALATKVKKAIPHLFYDLKEIKTVKLFRHRNLLPLFEGIIYVNVYYLLEENGALLRFPVELKGYPSFYVQMHNQIYTSRLEDTNIQKYPIHSMAFEEKIRRSKLQQEKSKEQTHRFQLMREALVEVANVNITRKVLSKFPQIWHIATKKFPEIENVFEIYLMADTSDTRIAPSKLLAKANKSYPVYHCDHKYFCTDTEKAIKDLENHLDLIRRLKYQESMEQ